MVVGATIGRGVFIGAVVLTACFEPRYQVCGALICPSDQVCVADRQCASPELVAACSGLADGSPCQAPDFPGTCIGGVCTLPSCGNGYIEGSEQCDGDVHDVDCADHGYDVGVPGCTTHCDLDLATCTRFGWQLEQPIDALPYVDSAWTDGARLAVVRNPSDLPMKGVDYYDHGTLVASIDQNTLGGVTGNASSIVAWDISHLWWSDGGAFTQMMPTFQSIQNAALAADGTLYVATNGSGCTVFELTRDTPPQPLGSPGQLGQNCYLALTSDGLLVAHDAYPNIAIKRWSGTSWQPVSSVTVASAGGYVYPTGPLDSRDGVAWAGYEADTGFGIVHGMFAFPDTGTQMTSSIVTRADGSVYVGHGPKVQRWRGLSFETLDARNCGPLFGSSVALYCYGPNGLRRYSGLEFSDRMSPGAAYDVAMLGDGTIVFATIGQGMVRLDDYAASFQSLWEYNSPIPPNPPPANFIAHAVAGAAAMDFYATDGSYLVWVQSEFHATDVTPNGFSGIEDLWAPAAGPASLYAVGHAGLIMTKTQQGWSTQPQAAPGCDLHAIYGAAAMLAIAGDCGGVGVVWVQSGTAWTEVYRGGGPLRAIAIADDGELFACGESGGARTRAGVWAAEPAAIGTSISATTSNDVFVTGGPKQVIHWDGTAWSRLAVGASYQPHVLATPHTVYLGGIDTPVLAR